LWIVRIWYNCIRLVKVGNIRIIPPGAIVKQVNVTVVPLTGVPFGDDILVIGGVTPEV
jgi:hypothetical protein